MHGDDILHEVLHFGYKLALGINAVVVERRSHVAHNLPTVTAIYSDLQ